MEREICGQVDDLWLGGEGDVWLGGQEDLWLEGEGGVLDVWVLALTFFSSLTEPSSSLHFFLEHAFLLILAPCARLPLACVFKGNTVVTLLVPLIASSDVHLRMAVSDFTLHVNSLSC